jgi:hypothetical protein
MMLPRAQAERGSDPRATEEIEWWGDEDILERILCRCGEMKLSGCDPPDSVVLASRLDVDLDSALALLRRGCPPALAVRILA